MDRRQDQFENTPGYIVVPAPYNYPGIGGGWMLVGYAGNMFKTAADAYIIAITGDAQGQVGAVEEVFLIPETFYIGYQALNIKKFGVNMYSSRGMDSDKDDYRIGVGDKYFYQRATATVSFFQRHLELSYFRAQEEARTTEVRDSDGNLIYKNEQEFEGTRSGYEILLDWTDDFSDPRSGFRFKATRTRTDAQSDEDPEYDVNTHRLSIYVPLPADSTWVFHYMRSSAVVIRKGITDLEELKQRAGYYRCGDAEDPVACRESALQEAESNQMANRYGTAETLGGPERLRSYPQGRYRGAHMELYGTELRWNFNTDKDDINLYFLNEIQEALQVCLFWEEGSTAEKASELGEIRRHSYGIGMRLVAASGNVYRFEYATGEEGGEMILMFNYPWN